MRWLKRIAAEILGLFVDDGAFALAIIIWLAVAWLMLQTLPVPSGYRALILFAGLALILVESAARRSRRSRG